MLGFPMVWQLIFIRVLELVGAQEVVGSNHIGVLPLGTKFSLVLGGHPCLL